MKGMQGTTGGENRRHPRFPREDSLSLRPLDPDHPAPDRILHGTTVDISASGLQIFTTAPLLIRQRLAIMLTLWGTSTFNLHGRVNRIIELDDPDEPEGFLAGIELTADSPDLAAWRDVFRSGRIGGV